MLRGLPLMVPSHAVLQEKIYQHHNDFISVCYLFG